MLAEKYAKGSMDTVLPQKAVKCQLGGLEATEVGKDGQIHDTMIQVDLAKLVLCLHVETIETHVKDRKKDLVERRKHPQRAKAEHTAWLFRFNLGRVR